MNHYEVKQAARRERLAARAERLRAKAAAELDKADLREEKSGIPFGQPILVGHHSERRHRRAIERADAAMRRSIEASKQAEEAARRASSIATAISSDDPDAPAKLRAKIEAAEAAQARMKAANAAVRKGDRAALRAQSWTEAQIDELFTPDFCGRVGFPDYALSNNNANIRRMKLRLAQLERAPAETVERDAPGGIRIVENAEANRLQIVFPDKPEANIRAALKRHGFRWSPTAGAWQRHLNNGARFAAELVLKED